MNTSFKISIQKLRHHLLHFGFILFLGLLSISCEDDPKPPSAVISQVDELIKVREWLPLKGDESKNPKGVAVDLEYLWQIKLKPNGSEAYFNDAHLMNPAIYLDLIGDYELSLIVKSGKLSSAEVSVQIKAGPCGGQAPVLGDLMQFPSQAGVGRLVELFVPSNDPDLSTDCGNTEEEQFIESGSAPFSISHRNYDLEYQWRLISRPVGSEVVLEEDQSITPHLIPDVSGTYLFELSVQDRNADQAEPKIYALEVSACGEGKPSVEGIEIVADTQLINRPISLVPRVIDADEAEGCAQPQSYTYDWRFVAVPAGSLASLNDVSLSSPSFSADIPGTYRLSLKVSDQSQRVSEPAYVDVVISDCGTKAPVISQISVTDSIRVGDTVSLSADVIDEDANMDTCQIDQRLFYQWTLIALPAGSHASLNRNDAMNPSMMIDKVGEYQVRLLVTDAQNHQSIPYDFSFTVGECGAFAPTGNIAFVPSIPVVGKAVALKVDIRDEDINCGLMPTHDVLWSLNAVPAGSNTSLSDIRSLTPSFMADLPGNYEVSVRITDNRQLTQLVSMTITVSECGSRTPTIDVIDHLPMTPGVGNQVVINANAVDLDHLDDCIALQINADRELYDLHDEGGAFGGDIGGDIGGIAGAMAGQTGGDAVLDLPSAPALIYHWRLVSAPPAASFEINDSLSQLTFTPSRSGVYRFELVVMDETGRRTMPLIHEVDVSTCGEAQPEIIDLRLSTNQPRPRVPFQINAQIVDTDEQCGDEANYRYEWVLLEVPLASTATISQAQLMSPSLTADLPGRYVVRCYVTDPRGLQSFKDITIEVGQCGSFRPSITAINYNLFPQSNLPYVGSTIELNANVSDQDLSIEGCDVDTRLTYDWRFITKPIGSMTEMSANNEVSPSFSADVAGEYVIRLVVRDADGFESQSFDQSITVDICGSRAPTATASYLPAQPNAGDLIAISLDARDLDIDCITPVLTYAWRFIEMPAGSRVVLQQPSSLTPSFTADLPGTYRLISIVTDETNRKSEPVEMTITVNECGSNAPIINSAFITHQPSTVNAGQKVELNALLAISDADSACGINESFQYSWHLSQAPAGSLAVISLADTVNPSLTVDLPGDYELELVVTDHRGFESAKGKYRFTVGSCGLAAPVVVASANRTQTYTGALVYLSALVSDADRVLPCQESESYTYEWTFDQIPAGSSARFNVSQAQTPSFITDEPGTYIVKVIVQDSRSNRSQASTIEITANNCGSNAPTIDSLSSLTINPKVAFPVALQGVASDADNLIDCALNQSLSYQWRIINAPAGSEAVLLNANTDRPSFIPNVAGNITVEAMVTDSTGLTTSQTLSINISACGAQHPSISATSSTNASNANVLIDLNATITDDDNLAPCSLNQSFHYTWQLLSRPLGSSAQIQGNGFSNAQFTPDIAGNYVVSVIGSDSNGLLSNEFMLNPITVNACGSAKPVINSITSSPASLVLGKAVQLMPTISDTDTQAPCSIAQSFSYHWRLKQVPAGSLAMLNQNEIEAPSFTPDIAGNYLFDLQVSDQNGHLSDLFEKTVTLGTCGLQAPVAQIQMTAPANLPSGSNVNRGAIVQFNGSNSSDPDSLCGVSANLSYQWILLRTPAGSNATLQLSNGLTPWFSVDSIGSYVVRLVVSDGLFNSTATDFTINGI